MTDTQAALAILAVGLPWLVYLTWLHGRAARRADALLQVSLAVIVAFLAVTFVRSGNALSSLLVGVMLGLYIVRWLDAVDQAFVRRRRVRRGA